MFIKSKLLESRLAPPYQGTFPKLIYCHEFKQKECENLHLKSLGPPSVQVLYRSSQCYNGIA